MKVTDMKREIKFRGKRVDTGEWIIGNLHIPNMLFTGMFICCSTTYGDIAPGLEDGDNFDEIKSHGCAIGHYHRVIPESVGEYTGYKDKYDNEIFEGHILQGLNRIPKIIKWSNSGACFAEEEQFKPVCTWSFDMLFRKHKKAFAENGKLPNHYIIGSEFENPDLL